MSNLFTMRLSAPIASLSGPRIDTVGDSLPIPPRSIITGIIGAALLARDTFAGKSVQVGG